MRLIGLLLCVLGTFARIGNAEARCDDEHLGQDILLLCAQEHPAQGRINRQACQLLAHGREVIRLLDRTEFMQQRIARRDGRRRGWIDEGE